MKKVNVIRKITAVLAATCVIAGTLAGCSGSEAETAAPTEAQKTEEVSSEAEKGEDSQSEAPSTAKVSGEAESMAEKSETGESGKILLAAAASLKNAFEEELLFMFQEKYPDIVVEGTYDSSGKLQTQIEEGLEADVFISAAQKQMKALEEEGLIASETIVDLLENKIVLIVPSGKEEGFSSFSDIEKAESIALGDPASVPAGQYAQEALTSLKLWDSILDRVSLGTNVTEVLNQVAEASADAGIVYSTDAASMPDKVSVVAQAPEGSLSQKVIYPAGIVETSAQKEAAEKFLEFLTTPEAMEVFISYGFSEGGK